MSINKSLKESLILLLDAPLRLISVNLMILDVGHAGKQCNTNIGHIPMSVE